MKNVFSRLVRQSGVYAVGNVALKLSGLVLVPLYLNLLDEATYGHFALLDATARVAFQVGGLGLATGLLRFLTNPAHEDIHDTLPFTALVTAAAAAGLLFAAASLAAPLLAGALVDDPERAPLVRLMALYAAFKIVEGIPIMLMRTRERAGLYVLATVAEMLVLIAGVFVLLVGLERGLRGIMEAYAVSAGVGAVVLTGGMLARVPWTFRPALVAPLVRFGTPLAVAGLAGLFMNIGDRYLLKAMTSAEVVAVYDWAARIGGALNMLFVQSFQLAFGVLGMKAMGEEAEGVAVYRRTFRHFVIWTGWSVLGLSLLALDFTRLVSTRAAYLEAAPLVLPIAFGFLAYGVYTILVNVLYVSGRTGSVASLVFGTALLNAGLNVVLIPRLGAMGAALATVLAYGALMALAARTAERQIRVGYAWRTLGVVVVLVVGLTLLGRPTAAWQAWPRLGVRLLLIAAYPALVFGLRLYTPEEARRAARLVRDAIRRRRAASTNHSAGSGVKDADSS